MCASLFLLNDAQSQTCGKVFTYRILITQSVLISVSTVEILINKIKKNLFDATSLHTKKGADIQLHTYQ